jgi:uncharacterized membrane protein
LNLLRRGRILISFLQNYRALILVVVAILALIIATPVIEQYVSAPKTESITELSVLGPYRNATYPYNLTSGDRYSLYFTVTNHLGSSANYMLQAKFRNQNQSGPDSFNQTSSSLPALAEFTFTVDDEKSIELPIDVSFIYKITPLESKANLNSIAINDSTVDMNNLPVTWDSTKNAYLGNIFFELYLYNSTSGDFQYNQRYVSLWVNLS